jgi:L-aspartate oxidase
MAGRHPLGDLAPRDVVAAAMQQRMGPDDHLWLDATALGRAVLARDFPTVTALCRARGIDPATEPIPVAPGAHYACGGIRADMAGRTSVTGLYAVGEAASTGVHGANRLASNSLTEALIAGRKAGDLLGRDLPGPPGRLRPPPGGPGVDSAPRPALAAAMSRHAGVLRDQVSLEHFRQTLEHAPHADGGPAPGQLNLATVEATSLHTVSVLVAVAALARAESRGCHRWQGTQPVNSTERACHTLLTVAGGEPKAVARPGAGSGL